MEGAIDLPRIQGLAHRFSTSCRFTGAEPLSKLCASLEDPGLDQASARELYQALTEEFRRADRALQSSTDKLS